MTDPAFVLGAYGIVLGGLVLYVVSIARRLAGARRTAEALGRERRRALADAASDDAGVEASELEASEPRPGELEATTESEAAEPAALQPTWDGR